MANQIIQIKDGNNNLYTREAWMTHDYSSSISSTYFSTHGVIANRVGDIVLLYLNLSPTSSCPRGSEIDLCTLSNEFLPYTKYNYTISAQDADVGCLIQVYANGKVTFYKSATGNNFHRGMCIYPAKN